MVMEVNEILGFAFSFFSDKNKTLQYFAEFRGFLLKSDKILELKKLAEFYQCIQFLNKINLIRDNHQDLENRDEKYYGDLECNLQSILELLISKHFKSLYQNDGSDTSKELYLILETVAYLMNVLQFNIQADSFEILLDSLCAFFEKLQTKLDPNCHNVLQETDNVPLFYASLKFLVRILNYIHLQASGEYLTEGVVLRVIEVLPFPDSTTVKFFIANIFPIIIQISSLPLKERIFTSLWNVITFQYKSCIKDGDSSVAASCVYNMLCCLSETIFDSHHNNVFLHDNKLFWDIVLSGVTSSYPFTRKRALNVFKIFLLWWSERGLKNTINGPSVNSKCRDIKIWNDVVTLFECLEEKQVHVIKPVLPKFSRILLLIPKDDLPSHGTFDLGSAWVMALICRMLKHETKFVIRWCLSTLLTMDYITYPIHKYDIESFVKIVVEVFNEQTLYTRHSEQDNYSLFLSSEKISVFLKNFICTLETDELKGNFLRSLINHMASQSWSVVALLHVTLALTQLENFPAWNPDHLLNVQKIILDCQRSQEPAFRVALEWCMMECSSLFINWSTITWEHLADFLMLFKSSTVLHNTKPWIQFALRLSDVSTKDSSCSLAKDKAHLFCSKSIKNILSGDEKLDGVDEFRIERFSRLLIMLADSSVISTCKESHKELTWVSLLNPVIFTLKSSIERPYMSIHEFLSALKLITILIRELSGNNESNHSISILNFLAGGRDLFQFMYNKTIGTALCAKSISLHSIIFEAFQTFSNRTELREILLKITIEMCHLLESNIVQNINILPIWRIINTTIYNICYTKNKSFKPELSSCPVYKLSDKDLNFITALNKTILLHILKNNLILDFLLKPIVVQENEKTQWLKFSHRMICDIWNIIFSITQHLKGKDLEDLAFPLVEEIKKTFNGGPKKAVPHSIRCLKHITAVVGSKDMSILHEILDCSWKACLEIRGNEAFRPALNSLIEVIFQKHMLHESFSDILYNYLDKFEDLSENTSGIFCTVIKQFCKEFSISALLEAKFNLIPVLRNALTYGPIHLKSHKIMEDTLIYLIEYDSNLANCLSIFDNNKPSSFVRIEVINYLSISYSDDLENTDDFSFNLIASLMQLEAASDNARSSQFANSFCHRLKNRAWQAILFILPSIKSNLILEKVFMLTFDYIGSENQQPSIRYMQEWVIFYLCSHSDLLDTYISYFENSLERRPSYIISIISILNFLILHQVLKEEDKLIRCFKLVIVFSMAQNFTVRLYAQLALKNLCTLCKNLNIGKSILQYEFVTQVSEMQSVVSDQGNFFKNVQKLSQDFYFSSFDPVNHFTLETLFYELPRLSNLCPDEWIKPSLFGIKNSYLEIYNNDEKLKNSVSSSWSNKPSSDNSFAENASLDFNFQKKIIPTKDIIGDLENLNLIDDKTDKEGLIVIASLIDRLPNLGGLCRTCEVFGVSEFVVGNIKFTEEKIFQNLAVSADKWVKTKEVKPHHLKDYLMSLKEEGYTLVGAEQTEDSHNLVEYKFPKKSALLLGHEKEGLPVDLIQLLDACVEIPQQGVIRSLNVHVSGAILIWEYARQNFTAPST